MIRRITISAILLAPSVFAAPFEIKDTGLGSSQLYLQCRISGMQSSCFLDTGSNSHTIQADQVSVEFPVVGKTQFSGASGATKECDVVSVLQVQIDSLVLSNQRFTRCSDTPETPTTIGITYFENSSFELDFLRSQITSPAQKPKGVILSPMRKLEKGHRIVSVHLSSVALDAIFDTGAGLSSIDEDFVKSHPEPFIFVQDVPAKDATGATFTMKLYQIKGLAIGGQSVSDDYVLAMPIVPDLKKYLGDLPLILGLNHIRKLNWYFDLSENTWGIVK